MNNQPPDELALQGRIQVETAHDALALTGLSPEAQHRLRLVLDIHDLQSDGTSQNDLSIHLRGEVVAADKDAIAASLDMVSKDPDIPVERRLAAEALRAILQEQ
jgi:hypothetical protein